MYHITDITRQMPFIHFTSDLNLISTASVPLRRWRKKEDGFVVPMIQRKTGFDRGQHNTELSKSNNNQHSVNIFRKSPALFTVFTLIQVKIFYMFF